jgi:hypothetical protein
LFTDNSVNIARSSWYRRQAGFTSSMLDATGIALKVGTRLSSSSLTLGLAVDSGHLGRAEHHRPGYAK